MQHSPISPEPSEVQEIRAQIAALQQRLRALEAVGRSNGAAATTPLRHSVEQVLAADSRRAQLLGESLLTSPAWELLLRAFVGEISGAAVNRSDLCGVSHVPATNAHRWINALVQQGWISSTAAVDDGTEESLSLTPHARSTLMLLLADEGAILEA